jgi:copper chaperone CopZ
MKKKSKESSVVSDTKRAILDLKGAHCASCAYTIEHLGRKIEGIEKVRVISDKQEIHVEYGGNPGSLERIVEIVKLIGYSASIRWDSVA